MRCFRFATIKEIADMVRDGMEIGFTLDTPEYLDLDKKNPSGWYGAKMSYDFDGGSVLFGDYGAGTIYVVPVQSSGQSIEEAIIEFVKWEGGFQCIEDSELCIEDDEDK